MIRRHGKDRDRGSGAIELVVVAPIFILIVLAIVGLGRWTYAGQKVEQAAAAGARAVVMATSPGQATEKGRAAVEASLGSAGMSCVSHTVDVDADWATGGQVTVTVECRVDLSDAVMVGLPGSSLVSATVTAPLETYRDLPGSSSGRQP